MGTDDALDGRNTYYDATATGWSTRSTLKGAIQVDATVIGGGLTGVSAALHLAERGQKVALLEADNIGAGGSGRNGGQSLTGIATGMVRAVALLGEAHARALWDLSLAARQLQVDLIARHNITCDAHDGYLLAATRKAHRQELQAEQKLLQEQWGYDRLSYLEGDALTVHVNSPRYVGGLLDQGSGHLHPLKLLYGLAAAAEKAGATLYENSAATAIDVEHSDTIRIQTAGGEITTGAVVLAGNMYMRGLRFRHQRTLLPIRTFILATAPLGAEVPQSCLPSNVCVSDCNAILDYFRFTADDRLLFGNPLAPQGQTPRQLATTIEARIRRVFPQLALPVQQPAYLWAGNVGVTQSRLPHFGQFSPERPNIVFAQGYSGHGLALSTLAGQILAEALYGVTARFDVFAKIQHRPFPDLGPLQAPATRLAIWWRHLRDIL